MRGNLVRVASWIVLSGSLLTAAAQAQLLDPEDREFHNTTYVGEEPEPARLAFYRAEEHLSSGRPKEAGREILKLMRGDVAGQVHFGERLVLALESAAQLFLLRLPEAVRTELAAEEAALAVAPPAIFDGADACRAFALRRPLDPLAEHALLRAGTLELLAGNAGAAAADLDRLVHWPTVWPGAFRPLAAARRVEASLRLGEAPAEGPLARWGDRAATRVAHAGADVALDQLIAQARAAAQPVTGATTLLGEPSHSARPRMPLRPMVDRLVVRHAVAADGPHRKRFIPFDELPPGEVEDLRDLPTRAPLVLGDRLVSLEPDGLHFRSLANGAELWPPLRFDFDLHLDPDLVEVVLDHCGLTASRSRLFLTLELRDRNGIRSFLRDEDPVTSALFGLDLTREGFVEFCVTSADLAKDPLTARYVLCGPVVEQGGRLYVTASRQEAKETDCALLAFDAGSGAVVGHRFLARAPSLAPYGDRFAESVPYRVSPSPVALRDGTLYVCTNLGVVAAVRAADLALTWLFRYHRLSPSNSTQYTRDSLFLLGPWLGRAPIVFADRVIASPADSRWLYSLACWPDAGGNLLLNEPIERQHRIAWIGATERELYFVVRERDGSRYLIQATDHDGSELWATPFLPVGERITGVPALADGILFVPTDKLIYRCDLTRQGFYDVTLAPPAALGMPYPEHGIFGDLAVTERYLISTSSICTIVKQAE